MPADRLGQELPRRYPALRRVGESLRRRRIPWVQQLTGTECGAACLAMVLDYYGKKVRLDNVREVQPAGRDGLSAFAILQAAQAFGLRGRGVKLELEDFEFLAPGAILHWEFNHFVVFEQYRKDGIDIVDPALGRRHVPIAQLRRAFTGVALLLEPSESFVQQKGEARPVWRHLRTTLQESGDWLRILVVSLLLQLFGLGVPLLTGSIVDRVVPRADLHLLAVVCIGVAGLVAFHCLASLIRGQLLLN